MTSSNNHKGISPHRELSEKIAEVISTGDVTIKYARPEYSAHHDKELWIKQSHSLSSSIGENQYVIFVADGDRSYVTQGVASNKNKHDWKVVLLNDVRNKNS